MTLEIWNTIAASATLLIVAATAIVALVQMRHMGRSNQLVAFNELAARLNAADFSTARRAVYNALPAKIGDPAFRAQLTNAAPRTEENALLIEQLILVGNYYEEMGLLTKAGLVDSALVCDGHGSHIIATWNVLREWIAFARPDQPGLLENFEYLTVLVLDWNAKHRAGSYPRRVRRIDLSKPIE